jgi:hypothetical protein
MFLIPYCEVTNKDADVRLFEKCLHVNELEDTHIDMWHAVDDTRILCVASAAGKKFEISIFQSEAVEAPYRRTVLSKGITPA